MEKSTLDLAIQEKINHTAVAIADEIVKEVPTDPFNTNNQRTESMKLEMQKQMTQFFEKLQEGLKELTAAVGNPGVDLNQLWAAFEKSAVCERSGISPKDYCNVSDSSLASFNGVAAHLYEGKNYLKSATVYLLLTYLDPQQPAFWQGLGNSEFFNQNYQSALRSYRMALEVNPEDFFSYLYSAHCFKQLKNRESSLQCVTRAIAIISSNPNLQKWKQPAEELKAVLTQMA